ncbi:MAG: DUF5784 family protein [Haloferacaceae archaeon]
MARPLRFRYAPGSWHPERVHDDIYTHLDRNLGAEMGAPWYKPPEGFEARRFDMDNGDTALFCWTRDARTHERERGGYWLGNTETPSTLWRTDKFGFEEVAADVAAWAERELLAQLHEESPWLADYPRLSWFFLPVFLSKDGRESTRSFFEEYSAGFPDADRADAMAYYEDLLATGVLDDYRELMAGKLGTSNHVDLVRMSAAMGEFNVARILHEAGYDIVPEAEVTTGHSLDYRVERDGTVSLVEVTRPQPASQRAAGSPITAVRETAETKSSGQLSEHGGGATLFVDCSSFPDDDWAAVRGEQPEVPHRPAVVFRTRPSGRVEAYSKGSVPLDLDGIDWA